MPTMEVIWFDTQEVLEDTLNADAVGVGAQSRRDNLVGMLTSGTSVIAAVAGLPVGELHYTGSILSLKRGFHYSQLVSSLPGAVNFNPDHIARAVSDRFKGRSQPAELPFLLRALVETFETWKDFTLQNPHVSVIDPDAYSKQAAYRNGLDQAYTRLLQAVLGQGGIN